MPPSRLSPSSAALWSQCSRRWWLKYVDDLPEPPPGEPAVVGTFVHRILELLLDDPSAERTIERAKVHARSAWDEITATDDWVALELDDAGGRRFRQRAWSTVEAYFSMGSPADVVPVARELAVEAEVAGVPFRGFIDLVEADPAGDGMVVITDYKTGRPPVRGKPWTAEREREKLLQPHWYAAALAAMGEHRPSRARLLFFTAIEDGQGRYRWQTAELGAEVTEATMDDAGAELATRWSEIQVALDAGGADASPGPLCGWCPYVDVCDEGRAEVERRWSEISAVTGERKMRADSPAVIQLGLADAVPAVA